MDTHPELPGAGEDTGFARILRDGNREPLARARETLKDRLLDQVRQEVFDEFKDTEKVVAEAMEAAPAADVLQPASEAYRNRLASLLRNDAREALLKEGLGDAADAASSGEFDAAKAAWKADLSRRLIREAVAEMLEDTSRTLHEHLADADVDGSLTRIRTSIKAELLDRLFQEAVAEIDLEMDGSPDEASSEAPHHAPSLVAAEAIEAPPVLVEEPPSQAEPEAPTSPPDVPAVPSAEELLPFAPDAYDAEDDEASWEGELSIETIIESEYDVQPEDLSADEALWESVDEIADAAIDFTGDGTWMRLPPDPDEEDALETELPEPEILSTLELDEEVELPFSDVLYIYGIQSGHNLTIPEGIQELSIEPAYSVETLTYEHLHAFLSRVPSLVYGEAALAAMHHDEDTVAARRRSHEEMVAVLSELEGFHPLPPLTVFDDEDSLFKMLADVHRIDALERVQGRSEWTIALHRNRETLHQRVVENSDAVQSLMAEIRSTPKGGASSIKKKMVVAIQEEMAMVTDQSISAVHDRLLDLSDDATLDELEVPVDKERGDVIFAATYLVEDVASDRFQEALEGLRSEFGGLGFELITSGPRTPALLEQLKQSEA